ncbi:MAG: pentapeptide repeat-containing protein [Chloroflexi bacterium]|nr:pentapeptide repeat-containing protein [Chloroflexota bacterium]
MKISSRKNIQPPQLPKNLPGGSITALQDEDEVSMVALSACDLANTSAAHLVFDKVNFRRAALGASKHAKPRLVDCLLEASDLSGIDWQQARFRRVAFLGCRLIGAQLVDAEFEDVTFKECTLENAVFLSSKFKAVRFTQCQLREASFESADLPGVVFDDCDLTHADLRMARLSGADFRGSRLDGVQAGAQEFKGAIVDSTQAIQIASLIGLIVKEYGEEVDE